jgi:hypothetical protein
VWRPPPVSTSSSWHRRRDIRPMSASKSSSADEADDDNTIDQNNEYDRPRECQVPPTPGKANPRQCEYGIMAIPPRPTVSDHNVSRRHLSELTSDDSLVRRILPTFQVPTVGLFISPGRVISQLRVSSDDPLACACRCPKSVIWLAGRSLQSSPVSRGWMWVLRRSFHRTIRVRILSWQPESPGLIYSDRIGRWLSVRWRITRLVSPCWLVWLLIPRWWIGPCRLGRRSVLGLM